MEPQIILASRSPRRRELLPRIGLRDFLIEEADVQEEALAAACKTCEETVEVLSAAKARDVSARHPGAVVIGSDTVVTIDGKILGKPGDHDEAVAMLRLLSGREHQVMSGVCVRQDGRELIGCEITDVRFRTLTDQEIEAYIAAEPPYDKAGAYGIQGLACRFVSGIRGDYYNVMGLPLYRLAGMLEELGISRW
ncbi:MAG: septum formation protein Maf [Ruminococcaceae bacterium]|nr:septum formation protein Maf [Oscillospiraceae bacterium]